jgi:hypothetical protein
MIPNKNETIILFRQNAQFILLERAVRIVTTEQQTVPVTRLSVTELLILTF